MENMNGASVFEEDPSVTRVKPGYPQCFQHHRTTVSNLSWGSTWSRKRSLPQGCPIFLALLGISVGACGPWGLMVQGGRSSMESQLRQPFWTHPWERPVMTSEPPGTSLLPQPDSVTLRITASSRPCQTERETEPKEPRVPSRLSYARLK